MTPDARVLSFSAAITIVTGVLFGCLPALRSTRVDLMSAIKQPILGGARTSRMSADKAMVALQAALSLVLIIGAGLFLRTIANLRSAFSLTDCSTRRSSREQAASQPVGARTSSRLPSSASTARRV